MQTIKEILKIATAGWGFFDKIEPEIGRLAVPTVLDKFVGLTDKKGNYLYFRFAGGDDYSLEGQKETAKGGGFLVSCKIKAVIVTKCKNIEEIAFAVAESLAKGAGGYLFEPKTISTDAGAIFEAETGKELKNNAARLAAIDFEVSWRHIAGCGLPDLLVCNKC